MIGQRQSTTLTICVAGDYEGSEAMTDVTRTLLDRIDRALITRMFSLGLPALILMSPVAYEQLCRECNLGGSITINGVEVLVDDDASEGFTFI